MVKGALHLAPIRERKNSPGFPAIISAQLSRMALRHLTPARGELRIVLHQLLCLGVQASRGLRVRDLHAFDALAGRAIDMHD